MLHQLSLLRRDGIEIADVSCRHRRGRGEVLEHGGVYAIVFVRRGCFVRSANGSETTYDSTRAYCVVPGQEQRYDHPDHDGDDCTALFLASELVESLSGGERALPVSPLQTTPQADLEHRLLLAKAMKQMDDEHSLVERALQLAAGTLERHDPRRVASGRPATARARRGLVEAARERLAVDPDRSLPQLAGELSISPHHLSTIFRQATGVTLARHRIRLRVRAALERLAGGDHDLSRLAAELGFADQSHLTRCIRAETRSTPAALRRALA
ncbi:MAG: helix-turn-helix domain-containing protein [Solirubrobacteraceae bacterium]